MSQTNPPRASRLTQIKKKLEDDTDAIKKEFNISTERKELNIDADQKPEVGTRRGRFAQIKKMLEDDTDAIKEEFNISIERKELNIDADQKPEIRTRRLTNKKMANPDDINISKEEENKS